MPSGGSKFHGNQRTNQQSMFGFRTNPCFQPIYLFLQSTFDIASDRKLVYQAGIFMDLFYKFARLATELLVLLSLLSQAPLEAKFSCPKQLDLGLFPALYYLVTFAHTDN